MDDNALQKGLLTTENGNNTHLFQKKVPQQFQLNQSHNLKSFLMATFFQDPTA